MIDFPSITSGLWRSSYKWTTVALLLVCLSAGGSGLRAQSTGTDTEVPVEDGKKDKKAKKDKKKKDKDADDAAKIGLDGLDEDLETIRDTTVSQIDTTGTHAGWLCARYRTGKMSFIDENFNGIEVKRKKKREIWYNTNTNNKSKFKIFWEGNCYYKLRFIKSQKPNRFRKGNEMGFKIVACYETHCDIDADLHAIMYYLSLEKKPTKKEKKLKAKQEMQKLKDEEKKLEEAEKAARIAEQEAKFGKEKDAAEEDGSKKASAEADGKESKEKPEKVPKEKKVKEKKEKAPKEKKEKEKKQKDSEDEE